MKNYHLIYHLTKHPASDITEEFQESISECTTWQPKRVSRIAGKLYEYFPFIRFFSKFIKTKNNYFAILMGPGQFYKLFPDFFYQASNKALYFFDAWPAGFQKIEQMSENLKIKTVFFSAKQTAVYFNAKGSPFKSYWVPEAIKAEEYRFNPYTEKDIDVLQFGRKYTEYHNNIVDFCNQNNIKYVYEKKRGEVVFSSKQAFVDGLARTKISICTPSAITFPERSGNISTMTVRYLQSMAAKCLILGIMPDDMYELFDYLPIVKIDMEKPGKQIENILANYKDYIPLIEKNYQQVQKKHHWRNRIESIEEILEKQIK